MNATKIIRLTITALVLNLSILSYASALTLSCKCQASATRSSISVVGAGLKGKYWVILISGGVGKASLPKAANASGVVKFDFDSNPVAIGAGARSIPAAYIKNNYVIVRLREAVTNRLLGAVGPTCAVVK
jgi:hypothetical protein